MAGKTDVQQEALALMALKPPEALGPLHGYGIARRIEQVSGDSLALSYGTIYPALLKLEQEGFSSHRSGAIQRIIARRSTTASRAPAEAD